MMATTQSKLNYYQASYFKSAFPACLVGTPAKQSGVFPDG